MRPINRIRDLIDHKKITISAFEKKIGMSNNSVRIALKRGYSLKDETLTNILNVYPDLSPDWLLMGRGPMLRPVGKDVENVVNSPQALGESKIEYDKAQEPKPIACRDCDEKERIIKSLEARLTDKDKQIGALENNLGMVISEKSEVIKMKDQMLEMQAKKIAELEEHSQTQKQDVGKQKSA